MEVTPCGADNSVNHTSWTGLIVTGPPIQPGTTYLPERKSNALGSTYLLGDVTAATPAEEDPDVLHLLRLTLAPNSCGRFDAQDRSSVLTCGLDTKGGRPDDGIDSFRKRE